MTILFLGSFSDIIFSFILFLNNEKIFLVVIILVFNVCWCLLIDIPTNLTDWLWISVRTKYVGSLKLDVPSYFYYAPRDSVILTTKLWGHPKIVAAIVLFLFQSSGHPSSTVENYSSASHSVVVRLMEYKL